MSSKLPSGSLFLVTGANGFIGSHIVDQLLLSGYRVRGTVRDASNKAWLTSYFDDKHGAGKFSLVEVPDFNVPGCFDAAVRGCVGVAHCAADLNMDNDPNVSVVPVVNSVRYALAAAAKEPAMRSFVLTSSSCAATFPHLTEPFHVDRSTYNDGAVRDAWAESFTDASARSWACYGASKVEGERVLWKFREEQKKPRFSVNAVLPNANFGPILMPDHQIASTAAWVKAIYSEKHWPRISKFVAPQWFVHVQDTARVHAAVLTHPEYDGERLFAFAEPFNWTQVLGLLRKITPDRKVPQDPVDEGKDLTTVENGRALEVLKAVYGQSAWLPLEEALKDNVKAMGDKLPSWFEESTPQA